MKFRFVDAATDELEEAINYSRANFGLGDELNAAVKDAIRKITPDPFRFPKRGMDSAPSTSRDFLTSLFSSPSRNPGQ